MPLDEPAPPTPNSSAAPEAPTKHIPAGRQSSAGTGIEFQTTANAMRTRLAAERVNRQAARERLHQAGSDELPAVGSHAPPPTISFEISYEQLLRLMLACDAFAIKITLDPVGGGVAASFSAKSHAAVLLGAAASQSGQAVVDSLEMRALDEIGRNAMTRSVKSRSLDLDTTDSAGLDPAKPQEGDAVLTDTPSLM